MPSEYDKGYRDALREVRNWLTPYVGDGISLTRGQAIALLLILSSREESGTEKAAET